ncbi:putative dual specificity protein phosphatase DSP8 [Bienertia sinuspersici]
MHIEDFEPEKVLGGESENKSSCLDDDDDDCRVRFSEDDRDVVVWDTKRVLIGAGARVLFYPTLVYNVVRNKFQSEFRWWDRVDKFVLLGAVPFPSDVLRLKELGVHGVITLNEPYETLVPTSLYHAHGIYHLVLPTRDYLFAPSLNDISQAVDFIHKVVSYCTSCSASMIQPSFGVLGGCTVVLNGGRAYFMDKIGEHLLLISIIVESKMLFFCFFFGIYDMLTTVIFIPKGNACRGWMTYVHCKAGRGRSTTIVLCYLVQHKQMTPEDAYNYVRSIRPRVQLASAQWQAVKDYYNHVVKSCGPNPINDVVVRSSGFSSAGNVIEFDDCSVVVVTKSDLDGYDSSKPLNVEDSQILADLNVIYKVRVAGQAALARLSCLWLRCQTQQKIADEQLLRQGSCTIRADQISGSLTVDIHVY